MDGVITPDRDPPGPLYDRDFPEWTREQAQLLRARDWAGLDVEHLVEELELAEAGLVVAVDSALIRVIEHLLKLEHSPAAYPRNAWRQSAETHRVHAARALRRAPSLRRRIDLADLYADARKLARRGLLSHGETAAAEALPEACPYMLEQILTSDWIPANHHGLA